MKVRSHRTLISLAAHSALALWFCRENMESADTAIMPSGEDIYNEACAQCHYAGERTPSAPSLKESALLKAPGIETVRIILQGQSDVTKIDGELFGGIMPAQAYMTDEEIAAVVRYVRKTFADVDEDRPQPSDVARLRAEIVHDGQKRADK